MFEIVDDPERKHIIYRLTCMKSGKVYIGYTKKRLNLRWSGHVSFYKKCVAEDAPLNILQKAFNKYGTECWKREIIVEGLTKAEALLEEVKQIALHESFGNKGYNATEGGNGQEGKVWEPYSRKKLSESLKEANKLKPPKKPSDETRKLMSEAKKQNHVRAIKVMFRGINYPSLRAAERATGITLHRIKAELADPEYINYPVRGGYDRTPSNYTTKDKDFTSRKEAADFYKVSIHNLAGYLKRNGLADHQPLLKIDRIQEFKLNT